MRIGNTTNALKEGTGAPHVFGKAWIRNDIMSRACVFLRLAINVEVYFCLTRSRSRSVITVYGSRNVHSAIPRKYLPLEGVWKLTSYGSD